MSTSCAPALARVASGARTQGRESAAELQLLLFAALHVPLALLMHRVPLLAVAHALATLAVAVTLALGRRLERVACATAYIVGAEVLWRLSRAPIPWEFGKYAVAAALLAALSHLRGLRWRPLPLLYFALFIPSALLTFDDLPFDSARQYVSFNLSGPLLLALSAWFFSHVRLSQAQLRAVFLSILAPVVGLVAITVVATYTADDIAFGADSNVVTSGGFGPNQVSALLGLGALLAFLLALDRQERLYRRALMFLVMAAAAVQSAMTFSRGGLYGAAGAAVVGSLFLLRNGRSRLALLASGGLMFAATNYVLLPRLNAFTNGALAARFEQLDTTNRLEILHGDLRVFLEHPVVGVGPGRAADYRELGSEVIAHTEFSRALAEHGVLGLASVALLVLMALCQLGAPHTAQGRALVAALLAWSVLFMLHSAMRVAAPSFVFALACARGVGAPPLRGARARALDSSRSPSPAGVAPRG